MSMAAMAKVWDITHIAWYQKLILLALSRYSGDDEIYLPSSLEISEVAKMTRMSAKRIEREVNKLVTLGLIKKEGTPYGL